MLAQFLVNFGSAAGRSAYTYVGESRHGTNLFVATVGRTARARKGTAAAIVARVIRNAEPAWFDARRLSAIGSGEAVVHAIRDPSEKVDKEGFPTDAGVSDKRLLIEEEEGASLFKIGGKDGSILSDNLRKAWDSPRVLHNAVKLSPAKATEPHVSVSAHITIDELRRVLTETDIANGLGNRFLWVLAERKKQIAAPKRMSDEVISPLVDGVREALAFAAGRVEPMWRDADAEDLWAEVYPILTRDHPGIYGSLTARAEAQVVRLSLIYALLDRSPHITVAHLTSALAFWRYCEDSARHIFGDRLGDVVADRIRDALRQRPGGMTETEIHALFQRNQRAARIHEALFLLLEHGYARFETLATEGRAATVWHAISGETP